MLSAGRVREVYRGARRRLAQRLFEAQATKVMGSPPIDYVAADWTILSMVSHRDIAMYLVAVKSFYAQLGAGKILIIDDGSLTEADKAALGRHLVAPTIIPRPSIPLGRFPRHIMWERLACALDLSEREYVIQLDADTITNGPIDDIKQAIAENRAFILDTLDSGGVLSAAETSRRAERPSGHIQLVMERVLTQLPDADGLRYVRGSAGLVGLGRGAFSREAAEDFYQRMAALCGDKILEWGSDQTAFNFIVANSPEPVLLPYTKYAVFLAEPMPPETAFLHFIGTFRFERGEYQRRARQYLASA